MFRRRPHQVDCGNFAVSVTPHEAGSSNTSLLGQKLKEWGLMDESQNQVKLIRQALNGVDVIDLMAEADKLVLDGDEYTADVKTSGLILPGSNNFLLMAKHPAIKDRADKIRKLIGGCSIHEAPCIAVISDKNYAVNSVVNGIRGGAIGDALAQIHQGYQVALRNLQVDIFTTPEPSGLSAANLVSTETKRYSPRLNPHIHELDITGSNSYTVELKRSLREVGGSPIDRFKKFLSR